MKYIEPYKESDYLGEFNLLLNEKSLIRKAWVRCNGHLLSMSRELEISVRSLRDKIIAHNLSNEFFKS